MCSCQKSTFARIKDTWTPKSDLSMGNYDPYPELAPVVKQGDVVEMKENYDCKSGYSLGSWPRVEQAIPMSQNIYSTQLKPIKEGYQPPRQPYIESMYSWGVKSKYEL